MTKLKIGTRGSKLALRQARLVEASLLEALPSLETEITTIRTSGDTNPSDAVSRMGGKGIFVKEIEEALLTGEVDVAVHSMKDLPSVLPEGLVVHSVLVREDPRDVYVSRGPEIVPGARIGTGSMRRGAQMLSRVSEIEIVPIRGNVDTRIGKILSGEFDGIVIAAAGLNRLGITGSVGVRHYPLDFMVSAPCQGIIAVERRENDRKAERLLSEISDTDTETEAAFERSFMRTFGGDCSVPLGCGSRARAGKVKADAVFVDMEKNRIFRSSIECHAEDVIFKGAFMARDLIEKAAGDPYTTFQTFSWPRN